MDSNVYCVDNEVLVDTGTGSFVEQTLEQMERFDVDKKGIEKIVLTHEHFDHTGATNEFKKKLGAEVLAHSEAEITEKTSISEAFEGDFVSPDIDERLEENDKIKTSNYTFEVLHTPGHSPGSIVLWDSEKGVLLSGDLIFTDGFGRTDIPGGDEKKIKESLRRIKEFGDISVLLPGHGTPASKENIYDDGAIENIISQIQ